ncbi:MAG TPA: trehalose-phosphatase [Nocardioides sp.]|nr:trehalose-phosphatase [Nocardioides sp.]
MEFASSTAKERYAAFVAVASSAVVGLDFDGTLAPIVDDPADAHIHPDAASVLTELAEVVRAVTVITGRPARQALALGGLDEVGNDLGDSGKELHIFGQYGNERWSSTNRRIVSPRPPKGLATYLGALPALLRRLDAGGAFVEEKGLAVAVHTRRLPDPAGAFDRLLPELEKLASDHGLMVEPGRQVIEARAAGMDKGQVVRALVEELSAGGFLFAGDDLGDVEAFEAVDALREEGLSTFLVCSGSEEQQALAARADLVVDGPDGVLEFLRNLTSDAQSG